MEVGVKREGSWWVAKGLTNWVFVGGCREYGHDIGFPLEYSRGRVALRKVRSTTVPVSLPDTKALS